MIIALSLEGINNQRQHKHVFGAVEYITHNNHN